MIIIKLFKKQGNKNPDPINDPGPWHAHLNPMPKCQLMNHEERAGPTLVQMA